MAVIWNDCYYCSGDLGPEHMADWFDIFLEMGPETFWELGPGTICERHFTKKNISIYRLTGKVPEWR
jgi:hypothetical protein